MRKLGLTYVLFFLFAAFLISCGGERSALNESRKAPSSQSTYNASSSANTAARTTSGVEDQTSSERPVAAQISLTKTADAQIDTAPSDRKVIRNAEMTLEADLPDEALQTISTIAESNGGFVVESQQRLSDIKMNAHDVVDVTLRVPSQRFSETLIAIRKVASRVVVENSKGLDVTEEFIDVEARLAAQKALEQQILEIMKRTGTIEQALDVQRQLADVRSAIEQIEGRKRFLENQSSLSTIKVKIQTPTVFAASSSGFTYRMAESFNSGWEVAMSFVLGLVTIIVAILPFAIIFGVPGYLIVRFLIKRNRAAQSEARLMEEQLGQ